MQKRSARWAERAFVAEGAELLRTALAAGTTVESVYLSPEGAADPEVQRVTQKAIDGGARLFTLATGVLERVADTVTPQPVMAVLPMVDHGLEGAEGTGSPVVRAQPGDLLVVLVDVRDPGNAGTVLRTADAAGARGVIFGGESVDPYNPKTVRASAGSIFHVPFWVQPDAVAAAAGLREAGFRTMATTVRGGEDYATVDWTVPTAVFFGNEAAGLDAATTAATSASLAIPMQGQAESLNVGVACAVVCFEALRQRRLATS